MSARPVLQFVAAVVVTCFACGGSERVGFEGECETGSCHDVDDAGGRISSDDAVASEPSLPLCIGTECQYPYATCPAPDGTVGDKCGVNLLTDNAHCGACNNACPTYSSSALHMTSSCVDGQCQRECYSGQSGLAPMYRDCNGLVDDGCERDVHDDIDNCGACGNKCTDICVEGHCGCRPPEVYCPGTGCVNTSTNPGHCGGCDRACTMPPEPTPEMHQTWVCAGGQCPRLACEWGWGDCNGKEEDGCETRLATTADCATCGDACTADQQCVNVQGAFRCICAPDETLCDTGRGCTDLQTDVNNCGACGHLCPGPPSTPRDDMALYHYRRICRDGFCDHQCEDGWGNCDGLYSNGCETNLLVSGNHCGACGNACDVDAGQPCSEGKCLMVECGPGEVPR